MSSSYKSDAASESTRISSRAKPGHTFGRDAETIYLQVTTADGKRHVLRDDLGTLRPVAGGPQGSWELSIPGYGTATFEDRDEALNEARGFLGDHD